MGLGYGSFVGQIPRGATMAEFIAVVNDTDAKNGGKSYALKITGNNHAQMLESASATSSTACLPATRRCPATNSKSRAVPTRPAPPCVETLKAATANLFSPSQRGTRVKSS